MTILGIWRILGAIALVIPRFPRLKEWAYAGLVFDFTSAVASHLFIGDVQGAISPFIFTGITFASWASRPSSRKLYSRRAPVRPMRPRPALMPHSSHLRF